MDFDHGLTTWFKADSAKPFHQLDEVDVSSCCGPVKGPFIRQTETTPWSEDPTRTLNNEIAELRSRVSFPQHWSPGEHQQNLDRLQQLEQKKRHIQQQQQQK